MKRLSCGRKLRKCAAKDKDGKPRHKSAVVWTLKTLGEYCGHDKLQPECYKLCCRCCPKSQEDVMLDTTKELRDEGEREVLLDKLSDRERVESIK